MNMGLAAGLAAGGRLQTALRSWLPADRRLDWKKNKGGWAELFAQWTATTDDTLIMSCSVTPVDFLIRPGCNVRPGILFGLWFSAAECRGRLKE